MSQGKKKNNRLKNVSSSDSSEAGDSKRNDDKRDKYPAFSAQQCFARIDNYLKNLLKKNHIPLVCLRYL